MGLRVGVREAVNDAGTCKGEPECEQRGRGRIKMTAETQPFKAAYRP